MAREFKVYKLKIEDGNGYLYNKKVYDLVGEIARDSVIVLCYDEITEELTAETTIGLAKLDSRRKEFVWETYGRIYKDIKEFNILNLTQFVNGFKRFLNEYNELEPREINEPILVSDESNLERCLEVLKKERIKYEVMNK